MASIDKIYGNYEQYLELGYWIFKNKPEYSRHLYLWEHTPEWIADNKIHPISIFPKEADMWLLDNCPIDWVVERIKEQYDIQGEPHDN